MPARLEGANRQATASAIPSASVPAPPATVSVDPDPSIPRPAPATPNTPAAARPHTGPVGSPCTVTRVSFRAAANGQSNTAIAPAHATAIAALLITQRPQAA